MFKEYKVSQRQVFKAVGLAQSKVRYRPRPKQESPVISELQELVEKHPSIGFLQSYYRIRRKGLIWNHKRIYRVHIDLKLNVRRRYRKRPPARIESPSYVFESLAEVREKAEDLRID